MKALKRIIKFKLSFGQIFSTCICGMTLNIVLFYPKGEQDEKDEEKTNGKV